MNYIYFALYQGTSTISRIIRGRGKHSHVEGICKNGSCVGAWHIGGVTHKDAGCLNFHDNMVASLSINHTPGTKVDIFKIECTREQADLFEELMLQEVGVGYDFWSIFFFVLRKPVAVNGKWFCSELFFDVLTQLDIWILVEIKASEVSPNHLGISPAKEFVEQIVTI